MGITEGQLNIGVNSPATANAMKQRIMGLIAESSSKRMSSVTSRGFRHGLPVGWKVIAVMALYQF